MTQIRTRPNRLLAASLGAAFAASLLAVGVAGAPAGAAVRHAATIPTPPKDPPWPSSSRPPS